MYYSYFDADFITDKKQAAEIKRLSAYREKVQQVITDHDSAQNEYSLAHVQDPALHDQLDVLKKQFRGIKHLVLVGIGGQNLGVHAVHSALDEGKVELHMLDTTSAHSIGLLLQKLAKVKLNQLAVCISSKSGNTAETLTNTSVLFEALEERFKKEIYTRSVFIGNPSTELNKLGKRVGATVITMPEVVGGRFSVTTEAGLVPLALLGHDVDAFISGVQDATSEQFEVVVAENAARVYQYIQKGYRHYNFFAFEPRLAALGAWHRQLFAESIGKAEDRAGKPITKGMLPTISTPVELHSIGQLYLSGFPGVYTDFVTFDDDKIDYKISKKGAAKAYGGHTVAEVATAIYGGVMAAYQEKSLPYRSTIFDENLTYSLGLFMGMRMLETMYIAELMNLHAFDQPNVELYKIKTRAILGIK